TLERDAADVANADGAPQPGEFVTRTRVSRNLKSDAGGGAPGVNANSNVILGRGVCLWRLRVRGGGHDIDVNQAFLACNGDMEVVLDASQDATVLALSAFRLRQDDGEVIALAIVERLGHKDANGICVVQLHQEVLQIEALKTLV